MIGITLKHVTDSDEIEVIQTILERYGFGLLQEQEDDIVAANLHPMTPDAITRMDLELIQKIGGHLEILRSWQPFVSPAVLNPEAVRR